MASRRASFDRIRITKVGFWYVLFALVVGLAATNTGNNALYLVEALMLALLAISGFISRRNLAALRVEVAVPEEVYAKQPFSLAVELRSLDRWFVKRLLVVDAGAEGDRRLVPRLGRRGAEELRLGLRFERRGRQRLEAVRVSSVFPLGLIFKSKRHSVDLDVLVLPEIVASAAGRPMAVGRAGEQASRQAGWGHELLTLRELRPGDDPRGIHWKQSARTGRMVYMEREAERDKRLSIVFDNAVGELVGAAAEARFERLVTEAASAAAHHLECGYEVELVTRQGVLPFGRGKAHRLRILEALALIGPCPRQASPLIGRERALEFRPAAGRVAS